MMAEQYRPISLWSGPRNVSTALMYRFAQFPELRVVDEPLYAHFLHISGRDDPGLTEIPAAIQMMETPLCAICVDVSRHKKIFYANADPSSRRTSDWQRCSRVDDP